MRNTRNVRSKVPNISIEIFPRMRTRYSQIDIISKINLKSTPCEISDGVYCKLSGIQPVGEPRESPHYFYNKQLFQIFSGAARIPEWGKARRHFQVKVLMSKKICCHAKHFEFSHSLPSYYLPQPQFLNGFVQTSRPFPAQIGGRAPLSPWLRQ